MNVITKKEQPKSKAYIKQREKEIKEICKRRKSIRKEMIEKSTILKGMEMYLDDMGTPFFVRNAFTRCGAHTRRVLVEWLKVNGAEAANILLETFQGAVDELDGTGCYEFDYEDGDDEEVGKEVEPYYSPDFVNLSEKEKTRIMQENEDWYHARPDFYDQEVDLITAFTLFERSNKVQEDLTKE